MSVQKIHLDHAQDSPRPLLQQSGQQAPSARGCGGGARLSSFRFVSAIVYNLSAGPRWALRGQGAGRKCWSLSSLT